MEIKEDYRVNYMLNKLVTRSICRLLKMNSKWILFGF